MGGRSGSTVGGLHYKPECLPAGPERSWKAVSGQQVVARGGHTGGKPGPHPLRPVVLILEFQEVPEEVSWTGGMGRSCVWPIRFCP